MRVVRCWRLLFSLFVFGVLFVVVVCLVVICNVWLFVVVCYQRCVFCLLVACISLGRCCCSLLCVVLMLLSLCVVD